MVGGLADGARPQQRQHEVIELPLPRCHDTAERREGKRKRADEDEEETEKPHHTRHRLSLSLSLSLSRLSPNGSTADWAPLIRELVIIDQNRRKLQ